MELKVLTKSARSVTFEIADGGLYYTTEKYQVYMNDTLVKEADTVVTSVFGLKPETNYAISIRKADGTEVAAANFTTEYEFVTLNVKDFGAKGDGISDDTKFIQAAILSCPKKSRVLIPAGTYKITSLFLKSNLYLELEKGAELYMNYAHLPHINTITDEQLDAVAKSFGLDYRKDFLDL